MRFIHADCEAHYSGRGETLLPRYERILCIKDDGSVQLVSDKGIKPLNYMSKGKIEEIHHDNHTVFQIESAKEYLTVTCYRIFSSWEVQLPTEEPGLIHDGTEDQIQEWLHEHLHEISSITSCQREFETGNGKVDILGKTLYGEVLVEVKRVATTAAVHQVKRYKEGSGIDNGIIIALDVRPSARKRAEKYGIPWMSLQKEDNGYSIQEVSADYTFQLEQ